jgi:hypothetical protein
MLPADLALIIILSAGNDPQLGRNTLETPDGPTLCQVRWSMTARKLCWPF